MYEQSVEQILSGSAGVIFDRAHGLDRKGNRVDGGDGDELDFELFLIELEIGRGFGRKNMPDAWEVS